MPFNQYLRPPAITHVELTNFNIGASHDSLKFTDSFTLGEPTFTPVHLLKFTDVLALGDTKSTSSPIVSIANRAAISRSTTRNSADRTKVRVQALCRKEQEFDNKTRQANPRIPE